MICVPRLAYIALRRNPFTNVALQFFLYLFHAKWHQMCWKKVPMLQAFGHQLEVHVQCSVSTWYTGLDLQMNINFNSRKKRVFLFSDTILIFAEEKKIRTILRTCNLKYEEGCTVICFTVYVLYYSVTLKKNMYDDANGEKEMVGKPVWDGVYLLQEPQKHFSSCLKECNTISLHMYIEGVCEPLCVLIIT